MRDPSLHRLFQFYVFNNTLMYSFKSWLEDNRIKLDTVSCLQLQTNETDGACFSKYGYIYRTNPNLESKMQNYKGAPKKGGGSVFKVALVLGPTEISQ